MAENNESSMDKDFSSQFATEGRATNKLKGRRMAIGSIFDNLSYDEKSGTKNREPGQAYDACSDESLADKGAGIDTLESFQNPSSTIDFFLGLDVSTHEDVIQFDLNDIEEKPKTISSILKLNEPIEPDWFFKAHRQKTPVSSHSKTYRIYTTSLSRKERSLYDESIGYRTVFDIDHALDRVEELYAKFKTETAVYDYAFDRIFTYGGKRKSLQPNAALYDGLESLKRAYPHFSEVIESVHSYFLLKQYQGGKSESKMQPILLNGPSGIGKTHFFTALADTLSLYREILNVSTMTSSFILTGSDPRWNNGAYGKFLSVAMKSKTINPMVFLEEIDKIQDDGYQKFPVINALVDLLEPETAKRMKDESFDLSFDVSNWLVFAASNDASKLPAHLFNRFNVFNIKRPNKEERITIYKSILKSEFPETQWDEAVVETMASESSDFRTFKTKAGNVLTSVLKKKGIPETSERPLVINVFDLKASGVNFKNEF